MGIRVGQKRGMVLETIDKNTPSDSLITISDRSDRAKSAESNALVGSEKLVGIRVDLKRGAVLKHII